jgi:hypothetical protein
MSTHIGKGTLLILLVIISLVSCRKRDSTVGLEEINSSQYLNGITDTFAIISYTELEDSTITDNPANVVLGSYVDPEFGLMNASFYTQWRIATVNPDFGDPTTIVLDSFVLSLDYAGYYGDLGAQTFEVYELDEDLYLDSTYYMFTTKSTKPNNLVASNMGTITPNPNNPSIVGTDTVNAQLRIPLDTNFARQFINEAVSGSTTFASNEDFLTFFKGIKVQVNNPMQSQGQGAILYFDLSDAASKATIYFTQDSIPKTYEFIINSSCADFNQVSFNSDLYPVNEVVSDSTKGMNEFFAQAFRHRAVVYIPELDSLPDNIIVHRADLTLPIQYQTGYRFKPGAYLSVATKLKSSDSLLTALSSLGEYVDSKKHFIIDLKSYSQSVQNGDIENTGVYLSPRFFINSAERVVFNGMNTSNKKKPQFIVTYTKF